MRSLKRVLTSAFLIFLISSNFIGFQIVYALGFSVDGRLRLKGNIGIFCDSFDDVASQLAEDLRLALDVANVFSTLYDVRSALQLDCLLWESGVCIAVYFFQTSLEGVKLEAEKITWRDFAKILLKHDNIHHILGLGNTRTLAEFVKEGSGNIHLANVEVIDAKLAFLYSLWEIAEVLKTTRDGEYYRDVELDIRCVGLKFFADEFNDLFERTLEPKVPLGEEDLLEKQRRYEEMIARFSYGIRELQPIPPNGKTPNEIAKAELNKALYANETAKLNNQTGLSGGGTISVSQENHAHGSRLYLAHMGDLNEIVSVTGNPTTETLYKVMDLPLKSGLDGPVGKVVDLLLGTLLSGGKDSVAMAKSTVEDLLKVVKAINLVVGIAEGSGGASELKKLFNLVKSGWPVLDDYDVFFDLFVDCIYALRTSNANQIKNVVSDVLNAILELTGSENKTASSVMNRLLDILFPSMNDLSQRLSVSERMFEALLAYLNEALLNEIKRTFPAATQIHATIENRMRRRAEADSILQSVIETILEGVVFAIVKHYSLNQTVYQAMLEAMYPEDMGIPKPSSVEEVVDRVMQKLPASSNETEKAAIKAILTASINVKGVFTDGYRWIFNQVSGWLSGEVEALLNQLTGGILQKIETYSFFHLAGDFPLGLGDWSAFQVSYDLALDAGINIRTDRLFDFVGDIIFDGLNWESGDTGDVFERVLSFVEVVPTFKASIEVGAFGTERNSFMRMLFESLGDVEISFEGGAHCNIELFRASVSGSTFMRVVEWGFYFKVELSRNFTALDFLTGGVGGSALVSLAEYVGLDLIVITVRFGISLDIVKRAASPTGPEQGTFTLVIQVGAALRIGITLPYIYATLTFYGSLDVIFTFIQDLIGDKPLTILMDLVAYVKATIDFLFFDIGFDWGPETIYHDQWPKSPGSKEDAENSGYAMGVDRDGDGLSDEYEERMYNLGIVLLNSHSNDTDGDGLTDKEEMQTTKTDPTNPDTDGDGLTDYEECRVYKTNPRLRDTDFDGLTDYEEVKIYRTNPRVMDTDQDGLDDYFEVHHAWDISNCTTSVKKVWIGGVAYNDHTDPLNPDTDNDELLDGEEGPSGAYYGLETPGVYNWTLADQGSISKRPIIFNYGYTHPLDNDTDDDSYLQWWNGTIALVGGEKRFLRSLTDGEEVKGIWVVIYDPLQDDWERKLIRTNPCNPDTDGDTGPDYPQFGMADPSRYINSDGYELSFNPPTDPTDGDSDHDGILDGLEGVLSPDSYHTNPMNPDTDGDGLCDLQEILLGTNPRNPDTDHDGVLDGDEAYRFHTNPLLSDSDFDGLTDGEEVYFWHTNPLMRDSDGDGISDGLEVLKYDTEPLDEDTDNDGINDYDEIFKYRTSPFDPDTDGDGLRDGEEAYIYLCDPLNWDTDGDSITYPNEYGQMTWPMSDGDEVLHYGTDPCKADTDGDGLSDALELYLGSGRIPRNVLEPIPLDALNADTDGDGLFDGEELRVGKTSSIIYPYLALMPYSFYNTSAVNPDTDGDGLSDFEEVNGVLYAYHSFENGVAKFNYTGSMPHLWDTDGDGLSDGNEVLHHGTDPCKADTDRDGIIDAYETTLYDTAVAKTSPVFYSREATAPGAPNASFSFTPLRQTASRQYLQRPPQVTFNASTSRDSDGYIVKYFWDFGDGANATKLANEANPTTAMHSYLTYGNYTVSLTVTDNAGLSSTVKANVVIRISTSALSSDSDRDKAPDGYEVSEIRVITYNSSYTEVRAITPVEDTTLILHYPVTAKFGVTEIKPPTDPLNPDSNGNGVLDGDEFDMDHDGVTDGDEFYTYETWRGMFYKPNGSFVIGGFLCADSDGDGLSDGLEIKIGTSPINRDTDGDGYSDGAEVALGTDPLKPTSPEEYQQALERFRAGKLIRIISPLNATTIDVTVSMRVVNSTYIKNMWFRYNDGNGWSQNFTLEYDPLEEQWKNTTMVWDYKSYHLEVYGELANGSIVRDEVWFTVTAPPITPPIYLWLAVGLVVGAGATSTSMLLFFRRKMRRVSKSKNEKRLDEEKEDKK